MSQNKKLEFNEIEYLTFEGGGAMGGAYLGALCAIQDIDAKMGHKKFPGLKEPLEGRTPDTKIGSEDSTIKGVSGSSIGAIFGLCVAMGYTAEQINARLITDKIMNSVTNEKL